MPLKVEILPFEMESKSDFNLGSHFIIILFDC